MVRKGVVSKRCRRMQEWMSEEEKWREKVRERATAEGGEK